MCRFALYLGPTLGLDALLTRPVRGLVTQSQDSREATETVHADGWGVAWYSSSASRRPKLFKTAASAWACPRLAAVARRVRGECLLAHIRSATEGLSVTDENAHPFTWRGLAFMHNGAVHGFDRIQPALLGTLSLRARRSLRGTTDSEQVFALLTDLWLTSEETAPLARLADATRRTIGTIEVLRRTCGVRRASFLNFAVSDGRCAVVSRASVGARAKARSLYVRTGRRNVRDADGTPGREPYVLVSSEPLDDKRTWRPVRPDHLLLIDENRRVRSEGLQRTAAGQQVA